MIEVNQCHLCQSHRAEFFEMTSEKGRLLKNLRCSDCGLVWLSPRLSPQEADTFYRTEFRKSLWGTEKPTPPSLDSQMTRAVSISEFLKSKLVGQSIESCLDVGCGSGQLVGALSKGFSAIGFGVELDEEYREYCKAQGIEAFDSIDSLGERSFDLITFSHVLEHLADPIDTLKSIGHRLSAHGRLYVEVPHLYGHPCFELGHNFSFTVETLKQTVEASGLEVVYVEVHGRPQKSNAPLFISLIAKRSFVSHQQKFHPEYTSESLAKARWRRRVGLFRAASPSQYTRSLVAAAKHLFWNPYVRARHV